jgi:hypothetical protein
MKATLKKTGPRKPPMGKIKPKKNPARDVTEELPERSPKQENL